MEHGIFKGEQCNREGCAGIIGQRPSETSCSCHINPPCSHCTDSREYCPTCGWEGSEEQAAANKVDADTLRKNAEGYAVQMKKLREQQESFNRKYRGEEKADELIIISEGHTHFSMIKKGVFPMGTETRASIEPKVTGTFGGRFVRFTETSFEYVAYTD